MKKSKIFGMFCWSNYKLQQPQDFRFFKDQPVRARGKNVKKWQFFEILTTKIKNFHIFCIIIRKLEYVLNE